MSKVMHNFLSWKKVAQKYGFLMYWKNKMKTITQRAEFSESGHPVPVRPDPTWRTELCDPSAFSSDLERKLSSKINDLNMFGHIL
jgi:hypothetical protein